MRNPKRLLASLLLVAFFGSIPPVSADSDSPPGSHPGDLDGDGLSNEDEAESGTIPEPGGEDSDEDGILDGADGWPRDSWVKLPRLPEARYAVILLKDVGVLEGTAKGKYTAVDLDDHGNVLLRKNEGKAAPDSTQDYHTAAIWYASTGEVKDLDFELPEAKTKAPEAHFKFSDNGAVCRSPGYGDSDYSVWIPKEGAKKVGASAWEKDEFTNVIERRESNFNNSYRIAGHAQEQYGKDGDPTVSHYRYRGVMYKPGGAGDFVGDEIKRRSEHGTNHPPNGTYTTAAPGPALLPTLLSNDGFVVGRKTKFSDKKDFAVEDVPGFYIYKNGARVSEETAAAYPIDISDSTLGQPNAILIGTDVNNAPKAWHRAHDWTGRAPGIWVPKARKPLAAVGRAVQFRQINNRGEILASQATSKDWELLVRNGKVIPLNDLVSGYTVKYAWKINNEGAILATVNKRGHATDRGAFLVPVDLAVDANRDGVIKFSENYNNAAPNMEGKSQNKTELVKPFEFWINDDHDGNGTGSEKLKGAADSADDEIESKRDLEDFARLNIYVGGLQDAVLQGNIKIGLKWKDTKDSPSIKVWQNRSPDGGDEYLRDNTVAGQHLLLTNPGLVYGSSAYIIPPTFWQQQGLSETRPCGYMLFEGVSTGKGQLVITIHNSAGAEIGEGLGVWLNLKTIKEMYERATALRTGLIAPFDRSTNFNTTTASFATDGGRFEKPWDETKECIVFVHGWDTDEAAYAWTSATLFKRLWHRGFKGRFAAFRWDTLMGPRLESFHISEWRAYKYGKSLQQYATNLKSRLADYKINVISHSLGAAVLASALEGGTNIDNCIFMQGSLSAHAFDPAVPNRTGMFNAPAPDLASDGGYRGWLTPASTNVVAFYNEADLVLYAWQGYQNLKPHNPTGLGQYTYSSTSGCRIEYSSGTFPTRSTFDQHESMAFVAVSMSPAIGAEPSAHNVIDRSVNIGRAPFSYGTEHGPQFDRNIQNNTLPFFREILDSFYIPFNP